LQQLKKKNTTLDQEERGEAGGREREIMPVPPFFGRRARVFAGAPG
jgi:hypothetical protein